MTVYTIKDMYAEEQVAKNNQEVGRTQGCLIGS